jgi:hypothetical protein
MRVDWSKRSMFAVRNFPERWTIVVQLSGTITDTEMAAFIREYRAATDTYAGGSHLVLADLRGMKPLSPNSAEALGEAIGYARSRGVLRCAHLSDDSVAKLQASRLARAVDPKDRVTVNVISLAEAEAALGEARQSISSSRR